MVNIGQHNLNQRIAKPQDPTETIAGVITELHPFNTNGFGSFVIRVRQHGRDIACSAPFRVTHTNWHDLHFDVDHMQFQFWMDDQPESENRTHRTAK